MIPTTNKFLESDVCCFLLVRWERWWAEGPTHSPCPCCMCRGCFWLLHHPPQPTPTCRREGMAVAGGIWKPVDRTLGKQLSGPAA